jgi:hypothetical protein
VTSIDGTGYVVSPLDGVNVWMSDLEVPAARWYLIEIRKSCIATE